MEAIDIWSAQHRAFERENRTPSVQFTGDQEFHGSILGDFVIEVRGQRLSLTEAEAEELCKQMHNAEVGQEILDKAKESDTEDYCLGCDRVDPDDMYSQEEAVLIDEVAGFIRGMVRQHWSELRQMSYREAVMWLNENNCTVTMEVPPEHMEE